MPTSEPLTTGEIARSLERIESGLTHVTEKLDTRPTWEDIKRIEGNLSQDIQELQNVTRWAGRIIIGGVLAALLALVLSTGDSAAAHALLQSADPYLSNMA